MAPSPSIRYQEPPLPITQRADVARAPDPSANHHFPSLSPIHPVCIAPESRSSQYQLPPLLSQPVSIAPEGARWYQAPFFCQPVSMEPDSSMRYHSPSLSWTHPVCIAPESRSSQYQHPSTWSHPMYSSPFRFGYHHFPSDLTQQPPVMIAPEAGAWYRDPSMENVPESILPSDPRRYCLSLVVIHSDSLAFGESANQYQ